MASGLGAFAQGLVSGYMQGKKYQQQKELHDLQVSKLKDEKAMNDALKNLGDVKPQVVYQSTDENGVPTVYADKSMADEAAKSGAQVQEMYSVGGKQFADVDTANYAAARLNSPAGKLQRQAQVAYSYGFPEKGAAFLQSLSAMRDANQADALDQISQAQRTGNFDPVIQMYNANLPPGAGKISLKDNGKGGMDLVSQVGDQTRVVGSYDSPEKLADHFTQLAMNSPKQAFDMYKFNKSYGLQERSQNETERHNQVSESIAAQNAGIAAQGVGLRKEALDFEKHKYNNPNPKVYSGTDANGNVAVYTAGVTPDGSGGYGLQVGAPQSVQGVHPTRVSNPFGFMPGMGGAATPSLGSSLPPDSPLFNSLIEANNQRAAKATAGQPTSPAPKSPVTGGLIPRYDGTVLYDRGAQ